MTSIRNPEPRRAGSSGGRHSPATLRRRENLRQLVARFVLGEMDAEAVARFLQCSTTTAYQYVNLLSDNGVICFCGSARDTCVVLRKAYRINPDPASASAFLELLGGPNSRLPGGALGIMDDVKTSVASQRPLSSLPVPGDAGSSMPAARRDPLVAALFGARRASS